MYEKKLKSFSEKKLFKIQVMFPFHIEIKNLLKTILCIWEIIWIFFFWGRKNFKSFLNRSEILFFSKNFTVKFSGPFNFSIFFKLKWFWFCDWKSFLFSHNDWEFKCILSGELMQKFDLDAYLTFWKLLKCQFVEIQGCEGVSVLKL